MMEQHPGMDQPRIPGDAGNTTIDVGAVLREAREQVGMSVEDVANRLKFASRQITALEKGDFAQLPEPAFIRGFVRSYARLLQIDEAPLLAALPGASSPAVAVQQEKKIVGEPFPNVYAIRKTNILWLAAALLVALVICVLAWNHSDEQTAPKPAAESKPLEQAQPVTEAENVPAVMPPASAVAEAAPASHEDAAKAAVPPVRTQSGRSMLRLAFDEDSWVEVKDENGNILLSLLGLRGSEKIVNKAPPYSIVIGHAQGVRLYFKGKPVDLAPYTNVDVARLTLK